VTWSRSIAGITRRYPPPFRIRLSLCIGAVEVFGGAEFDEEVLAGRELEKPVVLQLADSSGAEAVGEDGCFFERRFGARAADVGGGNEEWVVCCLRNTLSLGSVLWAGGGGYP
jgi:hypothetical protein